MATWTYTPETEVDERLVRSVESIRRRSARIADGQVVRIGTALYTVGLCRWAGEADHSVNCTEMAPRGPTSTDTGAACASTHEYAYTHGGSTFRAACDAARAIYNARFA